MTSFNSQNFESEFIPEISVNGAQQLNDELTILYA